MTDKKKRVLKLEKDVWNLCLWDEERFCFGNGRVQIHQATYSFSEKNIVGCHNLQHDVDFIALAMKASR